MKIGLGNKGLRGFTLIELLVVIAIIGLLATAVMATTSSVKRKAKDAKMSTEVHSIQLALEDYAIGNGGYPNPEHDIGVSKIWCIGANNCIIAGTEITDDINGWMSGLFPSYLNSPDFVDTQGNHNRGFAYVSCESNGPFCPNNPTDPSDIAYLIYPKSDSIRSLQVGTFVEQVCSLPVCALPTGPNNVCGPQNNIDCNLYTNHNTGACNYDPDGTGEITTMCICGPGAPGSSNGTENCNGYCSDDVSACNFDYNGQGTCLHGSECGNSLCEDPTACNYLREPAAPCEYTSCHAGTCIDPTACNVGQEGLCNYDCWTLGCTDENACNYDANAHTDDGSCEYTSCVNQNICGPSSDEYCGNYSNEVGACNYSYYGFGTADYSCVVDGCMNTGACNYNSSATRDDGSCEYTSCAGCMSAGACNYDSSATHDDGSCEYTSCAGCTDSGACNYNPSATINSGCNYTSCAGCTDSGACNYDSSATHDDGSCSYSCYIIYGCTNPSASNYNSSANVDNGSCIYPGCTDTYACNYNSGANTNDGSCNYTTCAGCTLPWACNYNPSATIEDGSCYYDC